MPYRIITMILGFLLPCVALTTFLPGFRAEPLKKVHNFAAEPQKLLKTLTSFVYSEKELFLRELISNGNDAITKKRELLLKQNNTAELDKTEFGIEVVGNPTDSTLTITDNGIGMTPEELVDFLGTISRSGTQNFGSKNSDIDSKLIGQHGIGFYSVFLVGERVEVTSKTSETDHAYRWSSNNDGTFEIEKASTPLVGGMNHGTAIKIHLMPGCTNFAKAETLREIIARDCPFFYFPIKLWSAENVTKEVPLSEEELAEQEKEKAEEQKKIAEREAKKTEREAKKAEEEAKKVDTAEGETSAKVEKEESANDDVEAELEPKKEYKSTKSVTETIHKFVKINMDDPIWVKDPKSVTKAQRDAFYTQLYPGKKEPFASHQFRGEGGDMEFEFLIYVPERSIPFNPLARDSSSVGKIKLFNRRVFVTESSTLLPNYLAFVVGIVNTDLALNINREQFQNEGLLAPLKRQLKLKVFSMIKELGINDGEAFMKFWKVYGVAIKLGVEDKEDRVRLAELLRFKTTFIKDKSNNSSTGEEFGWTTLEEYAGRMKQGQTGIFYLSGLSISEIHNSPFMEAARERKFEVLLFDDPHDQFVARTLSEYKGHKFKDIAEADIKFSEETEAEKASLEEQSKVLKPVIDFFAKKLDVYVESVVLTDMLVSSVCQVTTKYGHTGYTMKLMNAQSSSKDNPMIAFMNQMKKTLELNWKHPLITGINDLLIARGEAVEEELSSYAFLLYNGALIASGFEPTNSSSLLKSIDSLIRKSFNIKQAEHQGESLSVTVNASKDDLETSGSGNVEGDHVHSDQCKHDHQHPVHESHAEHVDL